MPIKFRCEHCRQLLGISISKAGQIVDCPTCGRAVSVPDLDGKSAPVPPPKLDLQDPSLQQALDALARIGALPDDTIDEFDRPEPAESEFPTVNSPAAGVPRGDSPVIEVPPAPRAVPIPLPALQQPVALPEPPIVASSPTPSGKDPDIEAPLEQLAAWNAAPKVRLADGRGEAGLPPPTGRSSSAWGVVLVALLAFATGFLVHAQFFAAGGRSSELPVSGPPNSEPSIPQPSPPPVAETAVKGHITFRTVDGTSRPDSGATVILLPETRTGSARLPIAGFRPADVDADRDIARAAIRALGGDLALVDESGNFTASLSQAGRYHVLVLSHFQPRPEGEMSLSAAERTILAGYFDRPDQLAGKLRYQLAQIVYRGAGTETWDYSFERI